MLKWLKVPVVTAAHGLVGPCMPGRIEHSIGRASYLKQLALHTDMGPSMYHSSVDSSLVLAELIYHERLYLLEST